MCWQQNSFSAIQVSAKAKSSEGSNTPISFELIQKKKWDSPQ
jgi:hypothetical protein